MRPQLAVLSAIVLAATATSSFSRTWYILPDGSGDAPTIQAGVDSAAAGDIVLVATGTYSATSSVLLDGVPTNVCVSITKNIRLMSEDGPAVTTIGNVNAQVVIYMQGVDASAEVMGFTVRSHFGGFGCVGPFPVSPPLGWTIGIMCVNSAPRIMENHITDNMSGIQLTASPALVSDNTITDAAYGVECKAGSDASIVDNVISMCGLSIYSEASGPEILGNDLSDGCTAIQAAMSSVVIRENTVHGFESSGIIGGTSLLIEANTFFDQPAIDCIQVTGHSASATIRHNVFYNVGALARLSGPGEVIIESNTIDDANVAISCEAASPAIRRNIIVNCNGALICGPASTPTVECNDIFDVIVPFQGACPDQIGINGNIAVDPQFCGVAGSHNYTLQGDSPCAAGNHPNGDVCGQIGALGVECGTVSTRPVTWGSIKVLYEGKRR